MSWKDLSVVGTLPILELLQLTLGAKERSENVMSRSNTTLVMLFE